MKAWRIVQAGRPLVREEVPYPSAMPGYVVIELAAMGLCHSDIYVQDGRWPTPLPITPGHEGAGLVRALGEGVDGIAVGDRVAIHGANACRGCFQCLAGRTNLCEGAQRIGLQVDGMFAAAVTCRATSVVPLPDGVDFDAAAVATDALLTPFHALIGVGRLVAGERVAIFGLGGLGLHAIQIAAAAGAHVIGIEPDEHKRKRAAELGIEAIPHASPILSDRVDLALDLVGSRDTLLQAQHSVRIAGRVVVVGLHDDEATLVSLRYGVQEVSLLGAFWGTEEELVKCLELLASGKVTAIVEKHPLSSVNEQLDRLRAGAVVGRVALTPDPL